MHPADQRFVVVGLTALLLISNAVFTGISLHLGAARFGYRFTQAMLLTFFLGAWFLNRKLDRLEFQSFMLQ
jgi:uncharacterized membrane protein